MRLSTQGYENQEAGRRRGIAAATTPRRPLGSDTTPDLVLVFPRRPYGDHAPFGARRVMASKRWRSYAAGSELDHFATFCREHLIQSEDRWEGESVKLEP